MIKLTRLNGEVFYANPDLMEFLEETPDTVISMTTGRKVIVRESVSEIIDYILDYRSKILRGGLNEKSTVK